MQRQETSILTTLLVIKKLIADKLAPEDVSAFGATCTKFKFLLTDRAYWQKRLALHFPNDISNPDAKAAFVKAYLHAYAKPHDNKDNHQKLLSRGKMFSAVHEGDVVEIKKRITMMDDLSLAANGKASIFWLIFRLKKQALLDYCYAIVTKNKFYILDNDPRLKWAAQCHQPEAVITTLVRARVPINGTAFMPIESGRYRSALAIAAAQGYMDTVLALLKNNADVNLHHPLQCAAERGHVEIVNVLLNNGAAIDTVSGLETAVSEAARNGHVAVVKLLITRRADINTLHGVHTPLMEAVQNSHVEVVKLLLTNGADPNSGAYHSVTPLCIALVKIKNSGFEYMSDEAECARALLQHKAVITDRMQREFGEILLQLQNIASRHAKFYTL